MPWRPRMMPPVGKSGPGMMLMSSSMPSAGIVDQRDAGVDHFAQIVRRNVGGHADRDAAGAVDQKIREFRRQNRRLLLGAVVVRLEIDGVLVDILEQVSARSWSGGIRYNASRPPYRRRPNRNCPARRSAARAWRNPAPCGPSHRRPTGRHGDGIYRSRRRRCAPTFGMACSSRTRSRASRRECGDAPA